MLCQFDCVECVLVLHDKCVERVTLFLPGELKGNQLRFRSRRVQTHTTYLLKSSNMLREITYTVFVMVFNKQ
ncbi:hypothetical protein Hanom_Chr12g01073021 [Helianthus anomalus]